MKYHYTRALLAVATVSFALICPAGSVKAAFPGANGKIVFQDYSLPLTDPAIATMNADGTGSLTYIAIPPLGGTYSNPTWSADGTKVAFDNTTGAVFDGSRILVVNADGSNLHTVFDGSGFSTNVSHPSWSPDGTRLAFDITGADGFSSIDAINANGTGLTTLLAGRLDVEGHPGGNFWEPAWSPDGTKIALREGLASGALVISILDVSSRTRFSVTDGTTGFDRAPVWSPDGNQIAFFRFHNVAGVITSDLIRIDLRVGGEINLTPLHADTYRDPAWSPDGAKIVATGNSGDLWSMNSFDGLGLAQLTTSGNADMADWQPLANTTKSANPQTLTFFGGSVTVTFDSNSVITPGITTVTKSATGPLIPPGFSLLGSYYEVSTTAVFTTATLCITDPSVTSSSRLLHYPGPTDVTQLPVVPTTICSTSLNSFSPFAIVQPDVVADTTPPALSISHVVNGANGWNVTGPVAVSIGASDAGSGLAGAPSCTDTLNGVGPTALTVTGSSPSFAASAAGEGVHVITCTVSDVAGNSASASDTVEIDTQAPVVSYTGNAGTYTTDQMINITCSAADPTPGSGLVSNTCVSIAEPASHFTLGPHVLSADATDSAGNVGHGSTSFTVIVTEASLDNLIRQFFGSDQTGSNGLIAKVNAIVTAPNAHAKKGKLGAFDNQVDAKTGNPLTAAQAALLKQLAAAL
jgi:Tol biopolymer transport system component